MSDEITLKSISELISWLSNFQNMFLFRGQRDSTWNLLPAAFRKFPQIEGQRLQRFKQKAKLFYDKCPGGTEYAKWLPLMQHYGVPTRLLDWSESPLCALFFAIENADSNESCSASVFCLNAAQWNKKYAGFESMPLLDSTDNKVLHKICKNAFYNYSKEEEYQPIVVGSSYIDMRMHTQMAWFTIHDNNTAMDLMSPPSGVLTKFIIPPDAFSKIRSELAILGIRRTTFFPDLENLAKEVADLVEIGDN